ncbi:MAG: hypothetical protein QW609_00660 [Candidatus Aenigmatarchaeota archaeon]
MIRKYGIAGLLIIIFAEITMFLRIKPFVYWFTPLVWFGYILFVDSVVFMLKGSSLITRKKLKLAFIFLISLFFWLIFEFYNIFLGGWYYKNLPESTVEKLAMGYLSFSTIVPAVFETSELVQTAFFKENIKIKARIKYNKNLTRILILTGIAFMSLPFFFSSPIMWVFVWSGFIFLIDPILYMLQNKKSIIAQLEERRYGKIISLFVAGYICGFLWEFWNYWAYTKWYYTVPILEEIKIFEIPAIGFLAYGFFALELYVMYNFIRFFFSSRIFEILASYQAKELKMLNKLRGKHQ